MRFLCLKILNARAILAIQNLDALFFIKLNGRPQTNGRIIYNLSLRITYNLSLNF